MRLTEKLWAGESTGHRVARGALFPLELIYRSLMAVRSELYDRGGLAVKPSAIAVVSVGNLTVGGTGKTPVSAWIAARLVEIGRKPAIVLRGYGDDEPIVHARLNPGIPVVVDRDRARGIARAAASGADVTVLDDAFQHRGAARNLDIVLVSADDWSAGAHVLPAGPYRESPEGLRRATLVVVTAKAAPPGRIEAVEQWIKSVAPRTPIAVARLTHSGLMRETPRGDELPMSAASGKRVLAIAAVGNPGAFFRQLEAAGASVVPLRFPDHHAFTSEDVRRAASLSRGIDMVVCTLKDAVKLAPIWPASEPPLWYVSLSVEVERGEAALDDMLRRLPARGG